MTDDRSATVPVWALATGDFRVPGFTLDESMTPERLVELRSVLAALAHHPIATLEVHPLPAKVDLSRGIALDVASPLAQQLSQFIAETSRSSTVAPTVLNSGEALYRMVIPAKFAKEFSQGIVRPMASKMADGGVYSALRGSTGVVANATFVPAGEAAAAIGATGAAAASGVALTVAAPLVLMAVAVAASAAAERQRQMAIEHITELLEQLQEQNLDYERNELDGCRDAIDKATAVLLDEGKLGASLGLDSAVHAIGKSIAAAERRLARWQGALDQLPDVNSVDIETLIESFPGIDEDGGPFHVHLELATLALALKRRVIVLQSVEHAQLHPGNLFENFVHALKADQRVLNKLESSIAGVLVRLSNLQLARPRGLRSPVVTSGEVDRLLRTAYRIRALGDGVAANSRETDLAIEIVHNKDGSVIVLPAMSA